MRVNDGCGSDGDDGSDDDGPESDYEDDFEDCSEEVTDFCFCSSAVVPEVGGSIDKSSGRSISSDDGSGDFGNGSIDTSSLSLDENTLVMEDEEYSFDEFEEYESESDTCEGDADDYDDAAADDDDEMATIQIKEVRKITTGAAATGNVTGDAGCDCSEPGGGDDDVVDDARNNDAETRGTNCAGLCQVHAHEAQRSTMESVAIGAAVAAGLAYQNEPRGVRSARRQHCRPGRRRKN